MRRTSGRDGAASAEAVKCIWTDYGQTFTMMSLGYEEEQARFKVEVLGLRLETQACEE